MARYRVGLTIPASGALAALAGRGLRIEASPLGRHLALRCLGSPEALANVARVAGDEHSLRESRASGGALVLVVETPREIVEILDAIAGKGAILLPPLVWEAGAVHVDAISEDPAALVSAIEGARLVSKSRQSADALAGEVSARSFDPALTNRQAEALLAAIDAGYYDAPRRATAGDVAASLGIARSTFEEHLRAAENAAVRALAPLLRLRVGDDAPAREAAHADAVRLFSRFSTELGLHVEMALKGSSVSGVRLTRRPSKHATSEAHPYLARVLDFLATGKGDLSDIPVDLEVSPFEREVLDALRAIPPGETRTYGQIAARVGRPGAARAVGNACAGNPALVLVPCHRVVPSSGGLGNYAGAGGARTKARLLELEGARGQSTRRAQRP